MARMAADAVALLGDRERTIIDLRFGLSSGEPMRLNEVGEEVGLSRERVRQILNESIEKLRSLVDMEEYKEVLS
jgi:RNA polymerase sigma factor (sigma-70 family)